MKKCFIYLSVLLLMAACNPMEDIYDDLDKTKEEYNKAIEYTLTADDYKTVSEAALKEAKDEADSSYAKAVADDEAFNDVVLAEDYMDEVLSDNFVALGIKSSARVTYNTTVKPEHLAAYASAEAYKLSTADYEALDETIAASQTFFPSAPAASYIPDILKEKMPTAQAGAIAAVTYNYSSVTPSAPGGELSKATFDDDLEGYTVEQVSGSTGWAYDSYQYVKVNTFGKGANESWLISPAFDLEKGNTVMFQVASYNDSKTIGNCGAEQFEVYYSTSHSGAFDAAQWVRAASIDAVMLGARWAFVDASLDLSGVSGSTVYVAFRHKSNESNGTTWEVDNVSFANVLGGGATEQDLPIEELNALYVFDGEAWSDDEAAYILNAADYDEMGDPGKYDNFSSSARPDHYLPIFLGLKHPYAEEGTEKLVVYKYYDGGASLSADLYTYSEGVWTSPSDAEKIVETSPFYHAEGGWVFDPAERFSISKDNYQLMVDHVKNTFDGGEDLIDSYGTTEYYYGNAAYYANIDCRISKRIDYEVPLTDEEKTAYGIKTWEDDTEKSIEITFKRIKEESLPLMLSLMYPDAQTEVSGVLQTYEITFQVYENDLAKNWYTYKYKCVKSGPNPEFSFVEDLTEK